jgi:DNA-directed RNA polymerase sigma subunit (sigma70/sigma32)
MSEQYNPTEQKLEEFTLIDNLGILDQANQSAEVAFDDVPNYAKLPDEVVHLLDPLDEEEREILRLRFGIDRGDPRTLEEVAAIYNTTLDEIRRKERNAFRKLRR